MSSVIYEVGDIAQIDVQFTDVNGNAADPTSISLLVEAPDGTQATYIYPLAVIKVSVGLYRYELAITLSGIYSFRWTGGGALVAVIEDKIQVSPTILAGPRPNPLDLCTTEQVQDWLAVSGSASSLDLLTLQRVITACGVYFLQRTGFSNLLGNNTQSIFNTQISFNEWYDGNGNNRLFLAYWPIVSVTALAVSGVTIPPSTDINVPGYLIDRNGKCLTIRSVGGVGRRSWGWGYGSSDNFRFGPVYYFAYGAQNINVQYTAGYTFTPLDIVEANIQLVALQLRRRKYIDQVTNSAPETTGTTTYSKLETNPWIERVIGLYRRTPVA